MILRSAAHLVVTIAVAVILALTLHVLMLVGVGAFDVHPETGGAHGAAAAPTQVSHAIAAGPTHMPHDHAGPGHLLTGCMALLAVLGMAVLVVAGRRLLWATEHPDPPQPSPQRPPYARDVTPPGPLVELGVLLRV